MTLEQSDFEHLLELRTGLRRFIRWSDQQAQAAGLTPAKHQLLLAIKGHPDPSGPTVGEVADYLVLRHHSAVGLIDRAVKDGLVKRDRDRSKGVVRVTLTRAGNDKLAALAQAHVEEIAHLAPTMRTLWRALEHADGNAPHPAARNVSLGPPSRLAPKPLRRSTGRSGSEVVSASPRRWPNAWPTGRGSVGSGPGLASRRLR